jgi:uncharacterized protein (TIGR03067 family)
MKLARRLNLQLGEQVAIGGGGFSELPARQMFAPGLAIGNYDTRLDWPNLSGVAADLSGHPGSPGGLLGNDFLEAWGVVIDFPSRALYLRPPLTAAWPRLAGTWKVTSWQQDGAARKLDPKAASTFTFADRRLKVNLGGQPREYTIRLSPNVGRDAGDMLLLIDPQHRDEKPLSSSEIQSGGLIKVKGDEMTLCLLVESDKPADIPTEFAAPKGSGYVLLDLQRTSPGANKPPPDPLRELLLKEGYKAVPLEREPDGNRMVAARIGHHDLRLMLRTGQSVSTFDTAGLSKWGAVRLGRMKVDGLGKNANAEMLRLRGMTLGDFDTRQSWAVQNGVELDLAGINLLLAQQKRKPIHGMLGNQDLLNGSAVIDYATDTLYLRPVKETLWPQLEGKWVGVAWESEGRRGRYAPGDGAVEFKNGRVRFITKDGTEESGFHVRDMGDRNRLGLFDPKTDVLADDFTYSSLGALRLLGDKLTLVLEHGRPRLEPSEFAAPVGSGLLLVDYERAK